MMRIDANVVHFVMYRESAGIKNPMTDRQDLKSRVLGIEGRTLAARLRGLMPDIDAQVRAGIRHEEIIEALKAGGVDLNLNTFRSYLYRYRRNNQAVVPQLANSRAHSQPVAPGAKPVIGNKGDLARMRERDFDLDELAEAAKYEED